MSVQLSFILCFQRKSQKWWWRKKILTKKKNLQVLLLDLKVNLTLAAQVVTCMIPSIWHFLISQISDRVLCCRLAYRCRCERLRLCRQEGCNLKKKQVENQICSPRHLSKRQGVSYRDWIFVLQWNEILRGAKDLRRMWAYQMKE